MIPIPVGQVPSEDDDVLRELPVQKTEDVPHSAPEALPEVSEHDQGEVDTQDSTSPHAGDQHMSLHDAVAASTKPGNTEEDIFPIVLDMPTKGDNLEEAFPSDQDNIGLTYIHPTVESAITNSNDFVHTAEVKEHDGSSMILDASAYPGGIIDIADPIPQTSSKLIPTIPMVGPVEPAAGEPSSAMIVAAKESSEPFVSIAVAPKDGLAKFVKPAGIVMAVGGGIAGLLSALWVGNKWISNRRRKDRKRRGGKERQRRHVRDWTMKEG